MEDEQIMEDDFQTTCINCKHGKLLRKYVRCGIEPVRMDPNDSCDCFEPRLSKSMVDKLRAGDQASIEIYLSLVNEVYAFEDNEGNIKILV